VEVDKTYLGDSEKGLRERKTEKTALIVVAAQDDRKGTGRIRMARTQDASASSLEAFIEQSVNLGSVISVIHTDGWEG
jgi:hypothetical protein